MIGFSSIFFTHPTIPRITNAELRRAIKSVKRVKNKRAAIQKAIELVTERFSSARLQTYLRLGLMWETDPNVLWQRTGFMHCTQQNYLVLVLLVQSGWFALTDFSRGYSLVWWVSPHQYLKVRLNDKWVALDPWNYHFGARIGTYACGFGYNSLP